MVAGLVALALGAFAASPAAGATVRCPAQSFSASSLENAPTLMVTFEDRPDAATAVGRLAGLGTVEGLAPEAGVWTVRGASPATLRSRVLRRSAVRQAEWSRVYRTHALTDPPAPPPITQPLQVLPEPTDALYADALRSWHLRTGKWSIGTSAYPRPIIAILDSGLDTTHQEWSAPGLVVTPYNVFTGGTQLSDVSLEGHGTHVAGIAGAPVDGRGVVGVAPSSPQSPIMPVRITNPLGESCDASMIAGIRWAVQHGAKVINISSGGEGATSTFQTVINWAYEKGALIVASVGNEGIPSPFDRYNPLNFPAAYDHVIGVAAQCSGTVDRSIGCDTPFRRARFSNFNASVDVLAPGVDIPSTIPLRVSSEDLPAGYGLKSGTSMAAPYVAGLAALIYASHPGITPFQVTRILEGTASRAAAGRPRTSTDGWGFVDPLAAVQATARVDDLAEPNDDTTLKVKSLTLRPTTTPVRLRAWADANDDPIDVYAVRLNRGERLRVTLVGARGSLDGLILGPGIRSLAALTRRQFDAKLLNATRRSTPGTRAMVIRARQSGRQWIVISANRGGGDYTLKIERL